MTVFEFIGQFFFQNVVFKLQEVFSEHGIRVNNQKYLEVSFSSHTNKAFSVFLEYSLRIISET
jgi:hypothetical protein